MTRQHSRAVTVRLHGAEMLRKVRKAVNELPPPPAGVASQAQRGPCYIPRVYWWPTQPPTSRAPPEGKIGDGDVTADGPHEQQEDDGSRDSATGMKTTPWKNCMFGGGRDG